MNSRTLISGAALVIGSVLLSIGIQALAYSAPTSAPTTIDAAAPLNTGTASQTKAGPLVVGNGIVTGIGLRAAGGDVSLDVGSVKVLDLLASGSSVTSPKYCIGTSCITTWSQAIDTSTFLNTSATAQTKSGSLTISTGDVTVGAGKLTVNNTGAALVGLNVANGGVVIGSGTITSTIGLALFGKSLKIVDGTEGAGKILGSAAAGTASWKDPFLDLPIQKRVTGTCPSTGGSAAMTGVNADGTVICGLKIVTGQFFTTLSSTPKLWTPTGFSFSNTNYSITITPEGTGSTCYAVVSAKTQTSFSVIAGNGGCAGTTYDWIAVGN